MLEHAHGNAADQVDHQDEEGGDGVAAHELGSTVHGAVEIRFARDLGARAARFLLADGTAAEVGVDGKLLARHGVQREARRHLGNAAGAARDDDEIDDDQDHEHHQAHGVVAGDKEIAEGFDHLAGRISSGMALNENDAGGRDVEREPHQRGHQQHGGKHGEVQRPAGAQAHQQHDHRQGDVEREQHVEHEGGQGQHHHGQDQEHQHGAGQVHQAGGRAARRAWRSFRRSSAHARAGRPADASP